MKQFLKTLWNDIVTGHGPRAPHPAVIEALEERGYQFTPTREIVGPYCANLYAIKSPNGALVCEGFSSDPATRQYMQDYQTAVAAIKTPQVNPVTCKPAP